MNDPEFNKKILIIEAFSEGEINSNYKINPECEDT